MAIGMKECLCLEMLFYKIVRYNVVITYLIIGTQNLFTVTTVNFIQMSTSFFRNLDSSSLEKLLSYGWNYILSYRVISWMKK